MIHMRLARKAIALSLAAALTGVCPFAAAKTSFDLCGPEMTKRPKIEWDVHTDEIYAEYTTVIKKAVKDVVALAVGTVDVPPAFRVSDDGDVSGHCAQIWENSIITPSLSMSSGPESVAVDAPSVAHELGHLIFQAILQHLAPKVFAKFKDAHDKNKWNKLDKIEAFIMPYAELFCDFVALLSTGELDVFGKDTAGLEAYPYRTWGDTTKLPWNKRNPSDNYPDRVGRDLVYIRFTGTRQFLWKNYRDYLQGNLKKRRQILAAVGEAMAAEIEANFGEDMTDRELNESLNRRIKAAMDQI